MSLEPPRAALPFVQHLLDTYASETDKTVSVWRAFRDGDLDYRPHPKSMTVADVIRHELLSARRFFGEFLGAPEPVAADVVPAPLTIGASTERLLVLAAARLAFLAPQTEAWWLDVEPFFDVERQRIWICWRRILHTAHHRTQLTVYLRVLDRPVPSIYGPTADVTWKGADPTRSVDAASRR